METNATENLSDAGGIDEATATAPEASKQNAGASPQENANGKNDLALPSEDERAQNTDAASKASHKKELPADKNVEASFPTESGATGGDDVLGLPGNDELERPMSPQKELFMMLPMLWMRHTRQASPRIAKCTNRLTTRGPGNPRAPASLPKPSRKREFP